MYFGIMAEKEVRS